MIYPDSLTSRVPATAISGLALRGRASDSSAFSSVSDTKMHRAFKAHQSADRSAEMNEYTRETKKPANEGKP
jgi:hypothetical protein